MKRSLKNCEMINLEINWSKTKCTHSPELIKKRYQKGWTIFQIVLILHMDAKSLTMVFWGCCFCFVSIFPFYLQEQHFFFLSGGLICTSGPLDFFKSCYGFMFFFLQLFTSLLMKSPLLAKIVLCWFICYCGCESGC